MTGPYCWECLLDLADSLLGAPPDGVHPEAVYRTVINRAYYAAFGALSTFYRDKGWAPRGGAEDHSGLRRYVSRRRGGRLQAMRLRELYQARQSADYDRPEDDDEPLPITERYAREMVAKARTTISCK